MQSIPDWQLPPGIDRGLWDYLHHDAIATTYDESLADTPLFQQDVQFAEKYWTKPGDLIDLGCGTGRLMIPFAQRGFRCMGVDASEPMLRIVEQKKGVSPIKTLKANLVELDEIPDQSMDYAACLFSTLGMIRTREHRLKFLSHVRRLIRPEGSFILHVHNFYFHLWHGSGRRWLFGECLKKIRGQEIGDCTMPQLLTGTRLTLHHFRRSEIKKDLKQTKWKIEYIEPISTGPSGKLAMGMLLPSLRAYGYLIVARPG